MAHTKDIFLPEIIDELKRQGMRYIDPWGKYIQPIEPWHLAEWVGEEVVLGHVCVNHLGDTLCMTHLPRKLKEKYGCKVYVSDNKMHRAVFANNPHVHGFRNDGKRPMQLSDHDLLPAGHIMNRLSVMWGVEMDDEPRPEVYLTDEEREWAAGQVASLSDGRPILLFSHCVTTRGDMATFADWPWQRWFDFIDEQYNVVQPLLKKKKRQWVHPSALHLHLTTREYIALFSAVDGYFGVAAGGGHLAAAFNLPTLLTVDHTTGIPNNFRIGERMQMWVYPYQQAVMHEVEYQETAPTVFLAAMRSGHHAIVNWYCKQQQATTWFHNEGLRGNPKRPNETKRYDHGTEKIHRVYNCEDFHFRNLPLIQRKVPDARLILVVRDLRNWVASCLAKREWAQTHPNTFIYTDLHERIRIWEEHARIAIHPPEWLYVISYDRWFADRGYRQQIAEDLGFELTDAGLNDVPERGEGSSFDGVKFDGKAQEMDVLNRYKTFEDDPEYQALVTPERLKLNERMIEQLKIKQTKGN